MIQRLSGHFWTIAPTLWNERFPPKAHPGVPWSKEIEDPDRGKFPISGFLHECPGAESGVLLVHGLGGSAERWYLQHAADAVINAGASALRISLRGSDGLGWDWFHAGQTADIRAALNCDAFKNLKRLYVLGFSIGGHASLRLGTEEEAPERLRAIAALCPPLDLQRAQVHIDRRGPAIYRRRLLKGLSSLYAGVAERHDVEVSAEEARTIKTFKEWDARIVAPRYGFKDAADYYRKASVAPRLHLLRIPSLLVSTQYDPMVPPSVVTPGLRELSPYMDLRWLKRGGHVGWPQSTDLGEEGKTGAIEQAIAWLLRH